MVVLSPRFTLLATLSAMAAFAFFPSTDGLTIQARRDGTTYTRMPRGLGDILSPLLPTPPSRQHSKLGSRNRHHRRPSFNKVTVNGDHPHVRVDKKRSLGDLLSPLKNGIPGGSSLPKRDSQQDTIRGRIDIVSPTANSTQGQTIASLALAPGNDTNTDGGGSHFVLNASASNSTQVYLVPTNQTQSSDGNSNSTVPYQTVMVLVAVDKKDQVDAMDQKDGAKPKNYCATFDPNPPAPEPLTAEECNSTTTPHKSQMFAYRPETGTISPMWYDGEDDSESGDDSDQGGDDADNSDYDTSSDSLPPDQDPATPSSDKVVGVTSVGDQNSGNSTQPPTSTNSTNSESPDSSSRSVVLVFTPESVNSQQIPPLPLPVVLPTPSANNTNSTSASSSVPTPTASVSTSGSSSAPSSTVTPGAKFASLSLSPLSSSSSGVANSTPSSVLSTSSASATPTLNALDVEVYNPYLSSTSGYTSASVSATPTVSGSASANDNAISSSSSASSSVATTSSTGASSSMTPVSTAPYEWMFKEGTVRER